MFFLAIKSQFIYINFTYNSKTVLIITFICYKKNHFCSIVQHNIIEFIIVFFVYHQIEK